MHFSCVMKVFSKISNLHMTEYQFLISVWFLPYTTNKCLIGFLFSLCQNILSELLLHFVMDCNEVKYRGTRYNFHALNFTVWRHIWPCTFIVCDWGRCPGICFVLSSMDIISCARKQLVLLAGFELLSVQFQSLSWDLLST